MSRSEDCQPTSPEGNWGQSTTYSLSRHSTCQHTSGQTVSTCRKHSLYKNKLTTQDYDVTTTQVHNMQNVCSNIRHHLRHVASKTSTTYAITPYVPPCTAHIEPVLEEKQRSK